MCFFFLSFSCYILFFQPPNYWGFCILQAGCCGTFFIMTKISLHHTTLQHLYFLFKITKHVISLVINKVWMVLDSVSLSKVSVSLVDKKKMWFGENINQVFRWRLVINKIDRCSTLIPWWQKKIVICSVKGKKWSLVKLHLLWLFDVVSLYFHIFLYEFVGVNFASVQR